MGEAERDRAGERSERARVAARPRRLVSVSGQVTPAELDELRRISAPSTPCAVVTELVREYLRGRRGHDSPALLTADAGGESAS